ncbi:MAG TPA: RtcB family protein [Methylomirabilota bacterium]|nr:RtcB family protein [Methylomirabilota bacterium]
MMGAHPLQTWLAGPLDAAARAAIDRLVATEEVHAVAIMPDAHLAEEVCVGTVVATRSTLFPAAIGGDIGCGVLARGFDGDASVLRDERAAARIMAGLYGTVPAAQHARPQALPVSLAGVSPRDPRLASLLERDGRVQLGTLGRGNHFLELQQSEDNGQLWAAVHSGSRAFGQAVLDAHLPKTAVTGTGLHCLDASTDDGEAYLADMALALTYADANRRAMIEAVTALVGSVLGMTPDPASEISCVHNFVRRERHCGEALWVHRKGAISARAGEPGIVPGSMGTPTFHVEGRGCERSLSSSSHGAGRAMTRSQARRRIGVGELRRQLRGVWYDERRADALRDEAPGAYKDIGRVMRAQSELTRIVRRLRPVLSYKGAGP